MREEEQTAESIKSQMTEREWEKVFEMSQDKNLYHNLCTSLFPTIHGRRHRRRRRQINPQQMRSVKEASFRNPAVIAQAMTR